MQSDYIVDLLKRILEESAENTETLTEEEKEIRKAKAAQALNLCMVSVSQIVDYDDVYILEQEYETILNNLNLENFPKDEALLNILKQLLDTITFFRIQEKDKEFIEKEYQFEMRNAIWKAVPNIGLLVAGGNPVTMAISLASQIGIGYMNYRNAKSRIKLQNEKQKWQLQRTAIEQFNGLRRELFDTAWRLADKYGFDDNKRLTEKQIKQFNDILMDNNLIRKYERLDTIKDNFDAYPSFWYYFGNTANSIYQDRDLELSDDSRNVYKGYALSHYDSYWKNNKYSLLRENHISSACALEQIDLLDSGKDRKKISELIEKAVKFSGNSNDILQLCVFAYIKIDETDSAEKLLRILVNEQFNTIINAQILSFIYYNKIKNGKDTKTNRANYEILCNSVNGCYLCRVPDSFNGVSDDEIFNEFYDNQKQVILEKYEIAIDEFISSYSIKFAKMLPVPDNKRKDDSYYSEESKEQRIKDIREIFESSYKSRAKAQYISDLKGSYFVINYFDVINDMHDSISPIAYDSENLERIVSKRIIDNKDRINTVINNILEGMVDIQDIDYLLKMASPLYFEDYFDELVEQIHVGIGVLNSMNKIAEKDMILSEFCSDNGLEEPVITFDIPDSKNSGNNGRYFRINMLGDNEADRVINQYEKSKKIESVIIEYKEKIKIEGYSLVVKGDPEFIEYIENQKLKNHKVNLNNIVAVLIDHNNHKHKRDLLINEFSIVPVVNYSVKRPISYKPMIKSKFAVIDIYDSVNHGNTKKSYIKGELKKVVPGYRIVGTYKDTHDTNEFRKLIKILRPMIEEIWAAKTSD